MGYPHFTGDCEDWQEHGSRICRRLYGAGVNGSRPFIVTLCGSTRFAEAFAYHNERLTQAGDIVLSVGKFIYENPVSQEEKDKLDLLHKRKIDLSDYILVLNVGGYIGESTRSEIKYAKEHKIRVTYLESLPDE